MMTPGPWAVVDTEGTIYCQSRKDQHQICRGPVRGAPVSPPEDEIKSNMAAIAELPKLVQALRLVKQVLDTHRFAGLDQNPLGVHDIVGSAVLSVEPKQ